MVCAAREVGAVRRELTVAGVLRAYADAVRPGLSAASRKMLTSLTQCRTAALGGHLALCGACGHHELRYHGCRDRHCPTCAAGRTARWLAARERELLPVPCYQVVFTVPAQLRALARVLPAEVYGTLMQVAVRALQDALTTKYEARFAITSVLHTWTRELKLHPHVHLMVSAGGLSMDDSAWVSTGSRFLVSNRILEPLFRAKMLAALRKVLACDELDEALRAQLEPMLKAAANKRWVIHISKPAGRGPQAFLRYLARYVFRVAIDDARLVSWRDDEVTWKTRGGKTATLSGKDFVRRFAQHALPKGFRKVRHCGLMAPGNKARLAKARGLLGAPEPQPERQQAPDPTLDPSDLREPLPICPSCGERAVEHWPLPQVRGPPMSPLVAA